MEDPLPMSFPAVSGIVPIHHEGRVIRRVLEGIVHQTAPPDELILVFDRCTDDSEAASRGYVAKRLHVEVGNTAGALMAGISKASHRLLVLFDGNTLVPPNYTARLLQVWEETGADLVEWHGGLMLFSRDTLRRFGSLSHDYLWTLEYFERIRSRGGRVERLDGDHVRLKPSPLPRNLRYGLDYARISQRYGLPPFFRIGHKSGVVPDLVAFTGATLGYLQQGSLRSALRATLAHLTHG